jgi:cytochrome d ubiquinol oxidase subunit II
MATVWFWLVAASIAMFVVLDGFDLGVGILHLVIARNEEERARMLRVISPYWDGNEVWLLAGGGILFMAFPALYAASFSGFYLPLMIVLWLFILRGISIEFRNHLEHVLWAPLWDVVFSGASGLLAIFFGAALGNVVRGVPFNADGYFFLPLWVDFRVSSAAGVLDWYTVVVGIAAFIALAQHGALWIVLKTDGVLHDRARALFKSLWWLAIVATFAITALSFYVQPHLMTRFQEAPLGFLFPVIAVAGLIVSHATEELTAFLGSCAYLLGMLCSVAWGLYPYVLPSNAPPHTGLTVDNSAAASFGLHAAIWWWIPGMILVTGYFIFTYRRFAGKVS